MIVKPILPSPSIDQIDELRAAFFAKLENDGAPCSGGFHPKDIERVKTCNLWLQRFMEQQDLQLKASLNMLWDTCVWRKEFGANDITIDNINMEYVRAGIVFPRNRDKDGKLMLIFKSKLHIRGLRDSKELLRVFVYWMERLYRQEQYDFVTLFFDLADTGIANLDLDHTKQIVNILKYYYPNALNYIFIYELPWVLTGAFKLIKALMPAKAVAAMRFVTIKSITDYVSPDNLLTCWGGTDDYQFDFEPEPQPTDANGRHETDTDKLKRVHFANLSPPDSPMSEAQASLNGKGASENVMLKISPGETITFHKTGNELLGTVDITNVVKHPITYKIKTTSPEKFRVRPSNGVLAAGASANINVVLQSGHNVTLLLNKDKFLVMCMELEDVNATQQDIAELWKSTQNSNVAVEQHRLKCSIATGCSETSSTGTSEITRTASYHSANGVVIDSDRQWMHVSNSLSQLVDTTRRLETRIKFNQKLQWITVFVFLLLSIAIVYILKIEIHNNSSEYCSRAPRNTFK